MDRDHDHILDEWLVLQTQDGDMKAYSILIKRWHPKMIRHAYRLTNDLEVAKDITQDSWNAITEKIRTLRSPTAFRVWVYRIISNKSADWIRNKQKERTAIYDQEVVQEWNNEEDQVTEIKRALNELPADNKLILTMFYVDGNSVKTIAELLNISEGTVKSRLFYSRKKLKERYENLNYKS